MIILDISNLESWQVREVIKSKEPFFFMSTHKQYHFRVGRNRLPKVPKGTQWVNVLVPQKEGRPRFNNETQRFELKPLKPSSPTVRYHQKKKKSKCTLTYPTMDGPVTTAEAHKFCEYDDYAIFLTSQAITKSTVITNDEELRRACKVGRYPNSHDYMRLRPFVEYATLTFDGERWLET